MGSIDEATAAPGVDLDDTTECTLAPTCEAVDCSATEDLAVATAATFGGVFCLTLCGECCELPLPGLAPLDALSRVCRHADHLGVDVDLMVELLDTEEQR